MDGDATPLLRDEPYRPGRERFVVDYHTGAPGPCFVVFAALHGDETAGVRALERVRDWLAEHRPPLRGRLLGVLGHLPAIAAGTRYLGRDLNRNWYEEEIARVRAQRPELDDLEDGQVRELADFLDALDREPNRPVVFLDLHSTSADGPPFICMPDTLTNLKIGLKLPIPSIIGLEETINGPLMGLVSDRGYRGVIVEGGRHDRERTIDVLESCIWVLLVTGGLLRSRDAPHFPSHWDRLASMGSGLPRVLEIKYRHETRGDDGFDMVPGFEHYRPVRRGELLATDHSGEIRAPISGRIIMPAYKPGTDQGFFVARDVPRLYVWILRALRRLRLGSLCRWLPGAHVHRDNFLLIDVAAWVPEWWVNIIRLLGWRRTYRDADHTTLRRRKVRR
jgi:succinylglutamate desuccinylase